MIDRAVPPRQAAALCAGSDARRQRTRPSWLSFHDFRSLETQVALYVSMRPAFIRSSS